MNNNNLTSLVQAIISSHPSGVVIALEMDKTLDVYSPRGKKPDLDNLDYYYIYKYSGQYFAHLMSEKHKQEFKNWILVHGLNLKNDN